MAGDIFLKLDGSRAKAEGRRHKDEIEIQSLSWGVSQSNAPSPRAAVAASARCTIQDLRFTKAIDKATRQSAEVLRATASTSAEER